MLFRMPGNQDFAPNHGATNAIVLEAIGLSYDRSPSLAHKVS